MEIDRKFSSWEDAVLWLRDQPERRQLVLDAYYDDPLLEAAQRYYGSEEWREIALYLEGRSGTALDIGAGRGIASYALARDGFKVVALEPDPSHVVGATAIRQVVHQSGLPIEVVEEFSEHLPFEDASFDVVFARAVLHHTRDLDSACKEMHRVLKSGGILIAVREHVISRESDLGSFLKQHPLHHLYGGEHAFLLSRYMNALEKAGFDQLNVLTPLQSPINLFPHTLNSLREVIIQRLSRFVPIRSMWEAILNSDLVLRTLLSLGEHFDDRPGRLYSFIAHKGSL